MDVSIKRAPSDRRHNSTVIGQGQAGSRISHRWACRGPNTVKVIKSTVWPPIAFRNASCCLEKSDLIGFDPAATLLIRPFSTGMVSEADRTTPFSLASASSLKPLNLLQSSGISLGTTGRNLTVLSW